MVTFRKQHHGAFVLEFHQEDLAKCKREVGSLTDKTVETVKDGAAEKAMAKMDKKERREITDHTWLKQEAIRYKSDSITYCTMSLV